MFSHLSKITRRSLGVAAAALLLWPALAAAQFRLTTPAVQGDQLFFFYDARTDRVPFLVVSNFAGDPIDVQVAYFNEPLTIVLAVDEISIPGLGHQILDPTAISSVKGNAGLVVVTPVAGDPRRPVVPPSQLNSDGEPPLAGSFTLANRKLGAGFGQNPFARIAVGPDDQRPAPGTVIDGGDVVYQSISPDQLIIPSFFDPRTLSPASEDGNRVLLASFEDDYQGGSWTIKPKAVSFDVFIDGSDGKLVTTNTVDASGVLLTDLQTLAGGTTLEQSGKVSLHVFGGIQPFHNVFGLFSQALGTFSVGQRMPGSILLPPVV